MRLLLTGAGGQLGTAFLRAALHHQVVPAYHGAPSAPGGIALDLADAARAAAVVHEIRPDWVVHAGAWTDVDGCERDPARARTVNAEATGALAAAARRAGARMCYVSTDYVFDGARGNYREEDATGPVQEYGRSKLEGERLARAALPGCAIARTSAVFAAGKRNFVTWVQGELRQGKPVRVARDQRVSPTWAGDLAAQVLALVEDGLDGTWHTAGASPMSRLEAARAIADAGGFDRSLVVPVASADLAWRARRPADSTLDVAKVSRVARPMRFGEALRAMGAATGG